MNFDWIKTRAQTHQDKVAIIDPIKGTEWTYKELNIRAENLANQMIRDGVQKGDRIGVNVPNDVAIVDFLFASIKVGAVFVPLNWRLKPIEIEGVIEDAGIKYIAYADNHYERLTNLPKEYLKYNVDHDEYNEIVDPSKHEPFKTVSHESDDMAMLIYTSGSTGKPKGVIHTHESYRNNIYNEIMSWSLTDETVTVAAAPMFHVVGFIDIVLPTLMVGGTTILQRYFDHLQINKLIAEYKPTILVMIPAMYFGMIFDPEFSIEQWDSVELFVSGGSAPLPAVQDHFKKLGKIIVNGYGLTEAPLVTYNSNEAALANETSIGRPVMNLAHKIVDEDMNEVPLGEMGELIIRGPNVTPGYYNLPEENEKAFVDGYFRTGDLATENENGELTIVNRLKELIITGGENVLPSEVEAVLNKHPLISQGIVVGYEHPKFGESVGAAVTLNKDAKGYDNYKEVLDEFMLKNLAGYKTPKFYLVLDEIPLNSTAKPDRLELQRLMNDAAGITDPEEVK